MIGDALTFFQTQLNSYIKLKTGGQKEESVQFPEIQLPKELNMQSNAVTALLVNLEEERVFRSGAAYASNLADGTTTASPPNLCLNFHLMFIANFKDYVESLRILSLVIKFFRSYRRFDQQKFPSLGTDIAQLSTELVNLSFMEQGELWRALEMPCSPSALYKVRMLVFQDTELDEIETGQQLGTIETITSQL
ncbi:DUF4255 domain-containing protein [Leptothoe spongobia]|uniref:DUF4255 domain-containing protein n=1 Tax=Leptothoe spongobia TAU-MAC 1115 TaxID=1967444 RepID=A0A947GFT5_9CYAN|nr:DUF4255 domain-containing protein [Leptothoe spongobia]MBT9314485.1 DUF4255 domain-containing protein [Leptothoe spongobia TAU-MAC 1115]